MLWERAVFTPGFKETGKFMTAVRGGFVLVGESASPSPTSLYCSKINYQGDTLWTRRLRFPQALVLYARGVVEDRRGNLAVTATAFSSGNPNRSWGILAQLNSTGDTLWSRKIGDCLNSLMLGNDGGYVCGSRADTIPAICKYDSTGRQVWQRLVPYSSSRPGSIFNLVAVRGGYLLQLTSDYGGTPNKFVGISEAGAYQQERLGSLKLASQLCSASDGNVLAAGWAVTKLSPVGDTIWSRTHRIGSNSMQGMSHVVELPSGRLLAAGAWFNGTTHNLTFFLLDRNGLLLRDTLLAYYIGRQRTAGIGVTSAGDYVWAGSANDAIPYNNTPQYIQLWFALRNWDRLLATQPAQSNARAGIRLYPNPADDYATLATTDGSPLTGHWTLCDLLGRTVAAGSLPAQSTCRLPVQNLAPGVYLVRVNGSQPLRLEKK
ncbi:T9SS type A sorting domain-containing protein [Hymenobacter sp. ASUV-10]|uniref:T9SS type A sorting domain-containing protein n=1 Tax=Hymenobacter aranciens TaxID=3063996 RepID=A0ABT9B4S2_9BACT|nr:T9SS type A sorting domain-containing protein [Hymenobacter sp. ASUV-10]MDO7873244.1 T9SS type A sorting domain-containing protein [Hymenobacter sp. ASUV-10]